MHSKISNVIEKTEFIVSTNAQAFKSMEEVTEID